MDDPTRPLIIINNMAARARRAWPRIKESLTKNYIRFDTCQPIGVGETEAQTRAALRGGYTTIAIVGGDGTLSEAASGFFEHFDKHCDELEKDALPQRINERAALAVLPAGTGDDFARGLTGHRASLEKWLERFIAHCRRAQNGESDGNASHIVDVMYASVGDGARRFICLNAATLGIGAEVAARVAAQQNIVRRLPGEARFALAAVGALAMWRERRVRVQVDAGESIECSTNVMAVLNSPYAGGGMNFSPAARMNDGQLDVVTACGLSRAEIVRELARIHRGGHLANPKVRVMRGARVSIEALTPTDALGVEADGDVRGTTPIEFRVMSGALRVIL